MNNFDPESILRPLMEENLTEVNDFLSTILKEGADERSTNVLRIISSEVVRIVEANTSAEDTESLDLAHNALLLSESHCPLDAPTRQQLIELLISRYTDHGRIADAIDVARFDESIPVCKELLESEGQGKRSEVSHSQMDAASVEYQPSQTSFDFRRGMFRSGQEEKFYVALRQLFQMHLVYPNVAIQSVIDWEQIKGKLSPEERDYFLRGVFDFVVIDHLNGYTPIHFVEIDSIFHDKPEVQRNDRLKDRIANIAGQVVIRVRIRDGYHDIVDISQLISEAISNTPQYPESSGTSSESSDLTGPSENTAEDSEEAPLDV